MFLTTGTILVFTYQQPIDNWRIVEVILSISPGIIALILTGIAWGRVSGMVNKHDIIIDKIAINLEQITIQLANLNGRLDGVGIFRPKRRTDKVTEG